MFRFLSLLIFLLVVRLLLFYAFPPPEQIIRPNPIHETTIFTGIKGHVSDVYSKYLSGQQASLLMGIVFGEKNIDRASNQLFINTGVLHVVAASGMNVSMLASFLLATLVVVLKRKQALVITALAIIFYAALADFQPSIVRAAIMSIIALGAGLSGRQNTSILALVSAAFVMVFWDPEIITSISFALSFSATLGIILLDPIFKKSFLKSNFFEDFRTTLSAQIATTPILFFFFGSYSPISILTNLLILWTVPPLMILGGIGALASFISPIFSAPFVLLSMPLLAYFLAVVDFFGQFAIPIEAENIPWTIVAGYYLVLLAIIIGITNHKNIVR